MTGLAQLIADCVAQGIRLVPIDGDGLTIDAPAGALSPDLVQRVKSHKGELLAILRPVADARTIEPTSAPSLWQTALDTLEGDVLFPAEMLEAMRAGDARWVPGPEIGNTVAQKQRTIQRKFNEAQDLREKFVR